MKVVYQPGTIAYAQLVVMEREGWLAEDLPGYEVSWTQVDAGAAVRDAMVNGESVVGAGGIGPFLVGYDSGIDWRILSALNDSRPLHRPDLPVPGTGRGGPFHRQELRPLRPAQPHKHLGPPALP